MAEVHDFWIDGKLVCESRDWTPEELDQMRRKQPPSLWQRFLDKIKA